MWSAVRHNKGILLAQGCTSCHAVLISQTFTGTDNRRWRLTDFESSPATQPKDSSSSVLDKESKTLISYRKSDSFKPQASWIHLLLKVNFQAHQKILHVHGSVSSTVNLVGYETLGTSHHALHWDIKLWEFSSRHWHFIICFCWLFKLH